MNINYLSKVTLELSMWEWPWGCGVADKTPFGSLYIPHHSVWAEVLLHFQVYLPVSVGEATGDVPHRTSTEFLPGPVQGTAGV